LKEDDFCDAALDNLSLFYNFESLWLRMLDFLLKTPEELSYS
jgi:hypothetical protein